MTTKTARTFLFQRVTDSDHAAGIVCRVRDTRYSSTWALTRTGPDVECIDPDSNADLTESDIRKLLAEWDRAGSAGRVSI